MEPEIQTDERLRFGVKCHAPFDRTLTDLPAAWKAVSLNTTTALTGTLVARTYISRKNDTSKLVDYHPRERTVVVVFKDINICVLFCSAKFFCLLLYSVVVDIVAKRQLLHKSIVVRS
jgi:hypothetical protein